MHHFVFLANAEPTLSARSVCTQYFLAYAQRKLNTLKRTLSIICRKLKKIYNFKLTLSVR